MKTTPASGFPADTPLPGFVADDGETLRYRHLAPAAPTRRAVVLLHRGHEHGLRWNAFLGAAGFDDRHVFAWDARGHGASPGRRGHARDFGVFVNDLDRFVRHLVAAHGVDSREIVVIAQSVGAVIAATWVHDYAPDIRALVVANPAFSIRLYVPFAETGLRLLGRVKPGTRIPSYVSGKMLTTDEAQARGYDTDPLVDRGIALNILLGVADAGKRAPEDAGNVRVPTLLLLSEKDAVVRRAPQEAYFQKLAAPIKERREYAGRKHALFNETGLGDIARDVRAFLSRVETEPRHDFREALVSSGENTAEFDRLSAPPSPAAALKFAAIRAGIRVGGKLAEGLRLGLATGFDSGATLDYVYRNRAEGRTFLGRLIDRNYLDSTGWRGIRTRRDHLDRTLADAVAILRKTGRPPRVLDIAAGRGRYVFDLLEKTPEAVAVLRDFETPNVEALRDEADRRGLGPRVVTRRGDAFDGEPPAPAGDVNLAIVSGLYELFHDNANVSRSLAALAASVEDGGLLVYTGQPRHPQLELIARTLDSHRGARWVMRRRSQAETDALVAKAGFRKIAQRADARGIFTVSLAVKTAS